MSLPSLSIRRHVFAAMLSIVLVLFGLIGYQRIGVDRYPQIEFPLVSVVTVLPGANPEIVDNSVTGVIESAVNAELDAMLGKLEAGLTPDEYDRVLSVLSGRSSGAEAPGDAADGAGATH